ncbi:MAG: acylneuraminate cytidylyltransferase family protein [Planctomycetes bacterium]|nr:acylneuraminate cytidylyltransferase family protein [Planctomycetota bacterium]
MVVDRSPRVVGLIPARSGSKRVRDKNVLRLGGHPLLAYTIAAARASGVFERVIVSTDAEPIAAIARHYGAEVPFLRPAEFAADHSPDIDWIEHLLRSLERDRVLPEAYSILRPTSPFRQPDTIRRAWRSFVESGRAVDSLRAVEKVKQHPGKMWVIRGDRLLPLLPFGPREQPWHSSPTQSLPEVFVQNASLEIAWTRVVLEQRTIAGETVLPFRTDEWEGFDINDPEDFDRAERAVAAGSVPLPAIAETPWG